MAAIDQTKRPIVGVLFWVALAACLSLIHSCSSDSGANVHTAGTSFFPLAIGNKWILVSDLSAGMPKSTADTVLVDNRVIRGSKTFYHVRSSLVFLRSVTWVRRDDEGNLLWCATPGEVEQLFLKFDGPVGHSWRTGMANCDDSLSMRDDYAVVNTPYGRFDGVLEIGDNRCCADAGWAIRLARGVGPVSMVQVTIAGARQWLLSGAQVHDDASAHGGSRPERIVDER